MNFPNIDAALRDPTEIAVRKDGRPMPQAEISRLTVADLANHKVEIKGQPLRLGAIYPNGSLAGFGWREVATGVRDIKKDDSALELISEAYNFITHCYVHGQWII